MPRIITGWIATILALGWAPAWTAAHPTTGRLLLGSAAVGQASSDDSPEMVRQKTIDLCKRARQAMDEGHYETAESLLGRAEAMNASFGMMYFGDTPKKVRRDLERTPRGKAEVKRPSAKFSPSTVSEEDRNEVARPATPSMAGTAGMTPPDNAPGFSLTDPKGQAKGLIQKARQELAQGNVAGATAYYRKAVQTGAKFNPGEDSPANLLQDLQRAGAKLTQLNENQPVGPGNLPPVEGPAMNAKAAMPAFPAQSPFNKRTMETPPGGYEARPFFAKEAMPEKFDPSAAAVLAPAQPAQVFGQPASGLPTTSPALTQNAASQIPSAGAVDPFHALTAAAKAPAAQMPATQPAAAQARTAPPEAAGVPAAYPVATAEGDKRVESDKLLLAARRALATGDVRRAGEAVAQAKAMGVRYDFTEDNPTKVEAAIYKLNELQQRPAGERNGESYRRRYAELQMQQADDMLRWREFDEAERLVGEAQRMGLNYGPFETSPEMLQKRIAETRKQAAGALVEALPSVPGKTALAEAAPPPTAPPGISLAEKKSRTSSLLKRARAALAAGSLEEATKLAEEAQDLKVPDSSFSTQDDRPFLVQLAIERAKRSGGAASPAAQPGALPGVVPATAVMPIGATGENAQGPVGTNLLYNPDNDPTKNQPATSLQPLMTPQRSQPTVQPVTALPAVDAPPPPDGATSRGMQLFTQGEEALRRHDAKAAMALFRQAQEFRQDLDPGTQQKLQDRLQLAAKAAAATAVPETLPGKLEGAAPLPPATDGSLMKEAAAAEQVKVRQVSADVNRQVDISRKARETDPKQAHAVLAEARTIVTKAQLSAAARDALMRRIDREESELDQYVEANRGKIELNERNQKVRQDIEHEKKNKVEVQEKIALMVDEFNKLIAEQRYDEAEVVAKRLQEVAPKEPVVVQIKLQAQQLRRMKMNADVKNDKERGFWNAMYNVDKSGVPFDDNNPYQMPDPKKWEQLTKTRKEWEKSFNGRRSEKDLEIEQRLRTPVSVRFKETPLAEVLDNLAKLAQVNLHLDPRGLAEEGVASDTPVTIDLSQEISLKSALSLILEPLHLGYVIKDEVLKITSEQLKDGEVITKTYNVADLVIPIPNFVPNGQMGLPGALADAHRTLGIGSSANLGNTSPLGVITSNTNAPSNAALDAKIMAQFNVPNPTGGMGGMGGNGVSSGSGQNIPFGPGGMGGGVQPDFDSLIELITGTIAPTTWSEVGGAGAIKQFATNLSLVISQTQEVHEEIADLLEQLRRLQDLQVTIEVRFLTLSDQFYEQMGIQMNIDANANAMSSIFGQQITAQTGTNNFDANGNITNPSRNFENRVLQPNQAITVGMTSPFAGNPAPFTSGNPASQTFSQDLGIPFSQTSFNAIQGYLSPLVGAGGIQGGGTLGFAILSDLEAYFFMQAVQDDQRSNIMQAPKVTLFNGQQAFVSDTTQSPFVITVIPVVGDFAAAQQPVIVVLSEGTFLSVQAVVSSDRRFVRLTVVPFFSSIGTVNTFTFTGSSSSTTSSSSEGPASATTQRQGETTSSAEGTTVQLPEFKFTTVTTTVSVPDGGTVLLGGIKRLTEERFENGVPILNKLPYINRLFNNVATFRSTSSLMMMVTPRIIIQEEEEALLGVQPNQ